MNFSRKASAGRVRLAARLERISLKRRGVAAVRENPSLGAYSDLTSHSLTLANLKLSQGRAPAVNLLLPALSAGGLFAGVRTAIDVGVEVARALNRRVRLVAFSGPYSRVDHLAVRRLMEEDFRLKDGEWELVSSAELSNLEVNPSDVWIATYWTTAHALDVRARLGMLDPSRVIYLIQDYEPSFLPASTDAFTAASTYKAGFVNLVNSAPLASALLRNAGVAVERNLVFAPQLDLGRLQQIRRDPSSGNSGLEVIFYGRPSKPRNMFSLGVAAMRLVVQNSDIADWKFSSVGEGHNPLSLGKGLTLNPLGSLTWAGYFERIARSQVMLSLQASPHPSHPPLDMVVSGGLAVTNEVDGTRASLHRRLEVADADPDQLAGKLVTQMRSAESSGSANGFDATFVSKLGVPMVEAASTAVSLLRTD